MLLLLLSNLRMLAWRTGAGIGPANIGTGRREKHKRDKARLREQIRVALEAPAAQAQQMRDALQSGAQDTAIPLPLPDSFEPETISFELLERIETAYQTEMKRREAEEEDAAVFLLAA